MLTNFRILCPILALLFLFGVGRVGAQTTTPDTPRDDRGALITFDTPPQRIVSLLPSLSETVCALGACDRLVGTDRFSDWPDQVASLPKLGSLGDIQIERLYALRPDLVLVAESARVTDRLESLGLTVVALEPRSLADIKRVTNILGEVLDLRKEAAELLAFTEIEKNKAANMIPTNWKNARVYFEISATPYAASEASFIGEILKQLGLENIVSAELGPFPKLNPEFIVRENPDIIMASRNALLGMTARPGWNTLSALDKGHTCSFQKRQHDSLVRPGPRLGEAALVIAQCIARLPSSELSQ